MHLLNPQVEGACVREMECWRCVLRSRTRYEPIDYAGMISMGMRGAAADRR